MIDNSLLPVGSCVKVVDHSKKIMIAGYLPYDDQKKIMYDYIGIYLPIGIRKPRQKIEVNKDYICFNIHDIEKVFFIGYSDSESDFYWKYLMNIKDRINSIEKGDLSDIEIKGILKESLPNIREIKKRGINL